MDEIHKRLTELNSSVEELKQVMDERLSPCEVEKLLGDFEGWVKEN